MPMTRQQRRTRLRELGQIGEGFAKRGLPRQPTAEQLFAAALTLSGRLAATAALPAATAFAAAANAMFEHTLKTHPGNATVACQRGCNWCCYLPVAASTPEILLVWQSHAALPASTAPSLAARTEDGAAPADRVGRKIPCLLLRPDGCSVYAARPLMCRVATSLDANSCRDEFEGRNLDLDVPTARLPLEHGAAVRTAMLVALRLKGLDDGLYDLAGAISELADRSAAGAAAERWLKGEAAFSTARALPLDGAIANIADRLMSGYRAWSG